MVEHLKVNRYMPDKAMDNIDHALGRPLDPLTGGYRNHFAICDASVEKDVAFLQSPNWEKGIVSGRMTFFRVTQAGREALAAHLKKNKDPHRAFDVTFKGTSQTVVATSHRDARYSTWLRLRDPMPDLTYGAFMKAVTVRVCREAQS
jgi:hypothetical protein